jgi:protein-S-isoprenylcysteine O-methyltransferase Ste14
MRQLRSLVLPFSTLVVIPGVILAATWSTPFGANLFMPALQIAFGALLCAAGLSLMAVTILMFASIGKGTLAPWDPTERLVTEGIYGRVRNPMIAGVLTVLLGISLLFGSPGILIWATLFFAGNTLYFHYVEEKGLEKRFGEEYVDYRKNVPMWLPRLRAWRKPRAAA